ncbi:MAG: hypothetical protein JW828_07470 [Sedimentisphaerales bacterium]|nr:hypothetical protein [Sedimentisphaerales bacterium]
MERVIIQYAFPDVAEGLDGLEACLVNFAYIDRLRSCILDLIYEDYHAAPVYFDMVRQLAPNQIQVRINAPCETAEQLFDRACDEHALANRLHSMIEEQHDQWVSHAQKSARTKLPYVPKTWHRLFEAIPREKHLPVLCVLLAKRKPDVTEQAHAEWVAEKIETILHGESSLD